MSLRVKLVIDSLGSGGAQRQLSTLAVLLKRRGLDMSVLTYHPDNFFLPLLRDAGVDYECAYRPSRIARALQVVRVLRRGRQDAVLAFLEGSSLYAELAGIPSRRWGLVVSERIAEPRAKSGRVPWKRWLHHLADCVVTNSHTNRLMVERAVPALTRRLVTVYNAVDLDIFCPVSSPAEQSGTLRLAVAASYQSKKNIHGLIDAVAIVRGRARSLAIRVDWYGRFWPDASVYEAARKQISERGLQECFYLHGESRAMAEIYRGADGVVLPSFFEGLPNVVCEAMACGRPVLMSAVCDAGNLIEEGRSGFLFDPSSPENMAQAILRFAELRRSERRSMGMLARSKAEQIFDPERFTDHYLRILEGAARREPIRVGHWVPEVPSTAYVSAG